MPRLVAMVGVLVALSLVFHVLTDGLFLNPRNLSTLTLQIALYGVLAAGMTMLLISRQIDLSAGSAVTLMTVIAASLNTEWGLPIWVVIPMSLAFGAGLGAAQGLIVAYLGVPSFVVTLGGMLAFRGAAFILSGSRTIGPVDTSFVGITASYLSKPLTVLVLGATLVLLLAPAFLARKTPWHRRLLARVPSLLLPLLVLWVSMSHLGLPNALAITAIATIVVELVLSRTRFGRRVYAIGGNPEAARDVGISEPRVVVRMFVIMGALYGLGGVMLTSRLGSAPPNAGAGLELDVISACIIGGVGLFGGRGNVRGAIVGVVLFGTLTSGMALLNIDSNVQLLVRGLILVTAVAIDVASQREDRRPLMTRITRSRSV